MTEAESQGIVGAVEHLGGKLMGSLPAQFLCLVVLNMFFIGSVLWFLNRQTESRERVLAPLLKECAESVPIEALRFLQSQGAH
jgi:hypothetical protein